MNINWVERSFSDCFKNVNNKRLQIPATQYLQYGEIPVIDQGQDIIAGYTNNTSKIYKCPKEGLIVFGDHTNIKKYVKFDFVPGADGTQLLIGNKNNTQFLYYLLNIIQLPEGYGRHYKLLKSLMYRVPRTIAEQQLIAESLSDVDELIENLEKLIDKKKNIKLGAMQELLTGKKRLPGFTKEWEEKSLGELLSYEQPTKYLISNTDYDINGIPVLTAGKTFVLGYTHENEGVYNNLPVIIFDDFLTTSRYVDFKFKVKSSAIKLLKLRNEEMNDLKFIFYVMQLLKFKIVDHQRYWISQFSKIKINVPDYEEQKYISDIITDMEKEINDLEQQLNKYKLIKRGMMEQLLTGKIRLA